MRSVPIVLLTLAAFVGCTDGTMVQPEPDLAVFASNFDNSQFANVNGGVEFQTRLNFVGPLAPGEVQVTPGGVMHVLGAANLFAFEEGGPLEGTWTFSGKWHMNMKTGKGKSINMDGLMVLTAPGTGTFDCTVTGTLEGYLPPDYPFIQYGNFTGCRGTGDFAGMQMKGRFTNEANPGGGNYDFWGVMW